MKRHGMTLIEITIASVILILVLIVAYSTFLAGDRFFTNESVVRDAQFTIRTILEQINQEISEGSPAGVWTFGDPDTVGGPNQVVAFYSARNPTDPLSFGGISPTDVHSTSSGPVFDMTWLALVVYAPAPSGGGKFELRRYTFDLPPNTKAVPITMTVTFNTATNTITAAGTTKSRSEGKKVLEELNRFDAVAVYATNPPPAGAMPSYAITIQRRVQITPKNFSNIKMTTTTKGRN